MHMNSAPHLLAEDRPDFERVLDQALRAANHDPELAAAIGRRLTNQQLRTMAVSAITAISACASAEYATYVSAREELRAHPPVAHPRPSEDAPAPLYDDGPDAEGAGAGAVLAVLAPVLAGIAALLFLLIGYVMRSVGSSEAVAGPMITVGWWFGGLTAAGVLIAMTGILLTALRNGRQAEDAPREERPAVVEEADRAREAWQRALLERGVRPFLREALGNAPAASQNSYAPRTPAGHSRTPHLGYSSPGFSSPDEESTPTRTGYTSPDFTSPDFDGSDNRPR
ncbi:hypothetical protein FHS39_003142 [Streptomyces olivoverticillatus]|uniref:Transmembrane protein n=1 Tax=Streptomyces olivoverticillatus TaxID=66427 RepID=A0A7W7PM46_9ACTN|nr:hypothetical protein [Streptomyces olivoverticillatus]MBB4894108.1 hypothetical protein [Streptomyces olivoverticillatus]